MRRHLVYLLYPWIKPKQWQWYDQSQTLFSMLPLEPDVLCSLPYIDYCVACHNILVASKRFCKFKAA